jgi:hypothetical protein
MQNMATNSLESENNKLSVILDTLGSFRFDYEYDYEYEIRQAKRMLYAYAIPY